MSAIDLSQQAHGLAYKLGCSNEWKYTSGSVLSFWAILRTSLASDILSMSLYRHHGIITA